MILNKKIQSYIIYLFLAFIIFLIFPHHFYNLPNQGLDNSWNIALHLAHENNFVHGKDIVFTYGPLGILNARYPISANLFFYLFFDIYSLLIVLIIVRGLIKKEFNYVVLVFIFLTIITAMYEGFYHLYFFFFLFFLFSFINKPGNFGSLVHSAVLSIVCFYFKVSFGIVALLVFIITIVYMVIQKKLTLRFFAIILGAYISGIWLAAMFLFVNLKGYLLGALRLINDYNDAMFKPIGNQYMIFLYCALFIILIVIVYVLYVVIISLRKRNFVKSLDQFFVYGITSIAVFITFKSGIVRADDGHVFIFFKGICLLVPFFYLYTDNKLQKKLAGLCCWIVLLISSWMLKVAHASYIPYSQIVKLTFIPNKIGEIKHYFGGLMSYSEALANSKQLAGKTNDLKSIIGNRSVDVIPTEVSKVYFNGLQYNPRPVIQSYSAYGEYLDNLNFKKYMSQDGPEYILFQLASIDERFPFFDESKTKLAILKQYKYVGEYNGDLILKRRRTSRELIEEKDKEVINAKMGEDIVIKNNPGLQYSKILVDYNFWGRIQRLLYIPPPLKIVITLANDDVKTYKAIKPIIMGGVALNKFVDNELEFKLLMLTNGGSNTSVKKIRIEPDSLYRGYDKKIKIINTYSIFSETSDAEKKADSLHVAQMFNKYKPSEINSITLKRDTFRYSIDQLSTHGYIMRIKGWAFFENVDNSGLSLSTVLRSEYKTYELLTTNIPRPDLASAFPGGNLTNSGFSSTVSKSYLAPGNYQLGIVISDLSHGKKWVNYTNQYLEIKRVGNIGISIH